MESPAKVTAASLAPGKELQAMERWVHVLEDLVRIPFTEIRFGLDVILGLMPVVGDVAGLLCGFPLLVAGVKRRLRFAVLLMMTANVLLDAVIGSIPVVGDIFDIAWKSHRKNLRLLQQPEALPEILREARWKLGALAGIVLLLAVALGGLTVFAVKGLVMGVGWGGVL